MKKRDYRLTVDGKYNMKAIMQRAWVYMRQNKSLKWYTFKKALSNSWSDARIAMKEYKADLSFNEAVENGTLFPNKNLSLSDLYSNPVGDLAMGYVGK